MTDPASGKDPCPFRLCLDDSERAIHQAHALFDELAGDASGAELPPSLLYRAKLAVHEWLANLIQHADFQTDPPEITLTIQPVRHELTCIIEDNSTGTDASFQDLDSDLHVKETLPARQSFPERGMGLAFIRACAHELRYERLDDDNHRLTLSIRAHARS